MRLCLVAVKKHALNKNMHLIKKLNKHHRWSRHQGLMPRVERPTTMVDENQIESMVLEGSSLQSIPSLLSWIITDSQSSRYVAWLGMCAYNYNKIKGVKAGTKLST